MFKRLKGQPISTGEVTKARKRVSRWSTSELLDWADSAGSGMAKAFSDYRWLKSEDSLKELRVAIAAMVAIYEELESRQVNSGG